jgi:hypothetical protein
MDACTSPPADGEQTTAAGSRGLEKIGETSAFLVAAANAYPRSRHGNTCVPVLERMLRINKLFFC